MRLRLSGIALAVLSAAALTACGGDAEEPGRPQQEPAGAGSGEGRQVFTQRCSSCHALADANAAGAVGPNLDELRPETRRVEQQVRAGGGGMPAFAGQLSDPQIRAVAEYVAGAAGK